MSTWLKSAFEELEEFQATQTASTHFFETKKERRSIPPTEVAFVRYRPGKPPAVCFIPAAGRGPP